MYLGGRRDAFHAFIYAPFEAKVRRLEAARPEQAGRHRARGQRRPRPRRLHPEPFRPRLAGAASLPPDAQLRPRRRARGGYDPRHAAASLGAGAWPLIAAGRGRSRASWPQRAPILLLLLAFPRLWPTRAAFAGSVRSGRPRARPCLSRFRDALERALKFNLGLIESGQEARAARAARLRSPERAPPQPPARVSVCASRSISGPKAST